MACSQKSINYKMVIYTIKTKVRTRWIEASHLLMCCSHFHFYNVVFVYPVLMIRVLYIHVHVHVGGSILPLCFKSWVWLLVYTVHVHVPCLHCDSLIQVLIYTPSLSMSCQISIHVFCNVNIFWVGLGSKPTDESLALGRVSSYCMCPICCWMIVASNLINHTNFHSSRDRVLYFIRGTCCPPITIYLIKLYMYIHVVLVLCL